ncbi:septal ring lytic transglycosylase RlpA family protein [Nonomuraea purpurea]|uniref:Probable endolytic peptidoglycan transglycosylase RlpA n=1 Tax=Nonomuraea purpurea TaxID=1849276 RepID=A0ABV8FY62_9ACTN
MGQHSYKKSPLDRKPSSGKRRWTAVAAGAAVIATASTAAWAAMGNDDSPKHSLNAADSAKSGMDGADRFKTPNEAARQSTPSAAPKPPAGARPQPSAGSEGRSSGPNVAEPTASASTSSAPKADGSATSKSTASGPTGSKSEDAAEPRAKTEVTKPKQRVISSGSCGASYYDEPQMTASGERFDPSAMTAAHKTLPLGSKVRVTNPNTDKSVTVRINDRGPYVGGRCLDLSAAAFSAIGRTSTGVMRVTYEVLAAK